MGLDDMDKTEKVKLFVAVGVLVIAMGVIGWYTLGGGGSKGTDGAGGTPAPTSVAPGSKERPAGNRRGTPGGDK
ncbi:MAG: hypothetical protein IT434_15220 [Phycisphaerales bacterium]|jgi:hypothetical protein|nr:hypothetical protein [Phycisphaerales bacterium]